MRTKYMNVVAVRQVRSGASVGCATCCGANATVPYSNNINRCTFQPFQGLPFRNPTFCLATNSKSTFTST